MPKFVRHTLIALAFLAFSLSYIVNNAQSAFASLISNEPRIKGHIHTDLAQLKSEVLDVRPWLKPLRKTATERVFVQPNSDWGAGHRGVDLVAEADDVIRAPTAAVIAYSGQTFGRPVITLKTEEKLTLEFEPACLSDFHKTGSVLSAGEGFAYFCPTSSGIHCAKCLHWGVKFGDYYLSPQRFTGDLKPSRAKPSDERFDNQT